MKAAAAAAVSIRKAIIGDVGRIQALVNHYASKETMLGLSLSEIYDQIRDFTVAEGPRRTPDRRLRAPRHLGRPRRDPLAGGRPEDPPPGRRPLPRRALPRGGARPADPQGLRADLPGGVLPPDRLRAGRQGGAAAQGLARLPQVHEVPELRRDRGPEDPLGPDAGASGSPAREARGALALRGAARAAPRAARRLPDRLARGDHPAALPARRHDHLRQLHRARRTASGRSSSPRASSRRPTTRSTGSRARPATGCSASPSCSTAASRCTTSTRG